MSSTHSHSATRRWIAGLVLAAFTLRSLIPVGFMLAPGRLLALEICPDGLSTAAFTALAGTMQGEPLGHEHEHEHEHEHAGHAQGRAAHEHPLAGGHHHPGAGQSHLEHCLFGGGSAAAPLPHAWSLAVEPAPGPAAVPFTSQQSGGRSVYVPFARGPPVSL
jgi:hypothetical protein